MWVVCSGRIECIYFVKTMEDEFWEKVGLMVEVMDCFVMSVGWINSSEEGSDSKDCSSDSAPARRPATDVR